VSAALQGHAWIALGANIDAPEARVREAMQRLDGAPFGQVVARSSLYRSAPVGLLDQPDFINGAVALLTPLSPIALMHALLDLEAQLGRVRGERNGPRRIDLDLIAFECRKLAIADLVLPHPRAGVRNFVLLPLSEIAPDLVLPGIGSVTELVAGLPVSTIACIGA
jgi:2-amino-4-hydroxy-6-hydroxymethyldihydropteridine diphosphokinase